MKDKQNTYRNHSGIGLFITFFLYKAHPTSAGGVERDGLGQKKNTDRFCWVSVSSSGFSVGSSGF